MGDGVDDGIVDARRFGDDDRNGRHQRRDLAHVTPDAQHADDGERSPRRRPQRDVQNGNFGDADLGRNGVLVGIAAQGRHVHLLGLLAQFVLVLEDGHDDAVVTADDDEHRHHKVEYEQRQYGHFVVLSLSHVVVRAPEYQSNSSTISNH